MREELTKSLGPIEFSDLRAHLARGAVIVVARSLDLLDAGEALARDDKAKVAVWIEQKMIDKPSLRMIERWSKLQGAILTSLVVQPFVLVQEMDG